MLGNQSSITQNLRYNLQESFDTQTRCMLRSCYCCCFTEMATQWKIAAVTCMLLFTLMEDTKPVLAKRKVMKQLVAKVSELEEKVECNRKYP